VYAIVKAGGRQEKVAVGDEFELDRVSTGAGESFTLPVLLVVDGTAVTSDPKALAGVTVNVEVLEHTKGPKIRIMHYKNKTGYKRRQGHRAQLTRVRVTGIETA
jgi:large subunit ribosomal protein L21